MLQFWQILISFEKCFLVILAKKIDCKQKTPTRNEPGQFLYGLLRDWRPSQ